MLATVIFALGVGLAILAAAGCAYTGLTALLVLRFFQQRPALPSRTAPTPIAGVTLLKPLHGRPPELRHDLESFFVQARSFTQAWAGSAQIVFGLQDPADPARAVVEALIAAHPDIDAVLCIDPTPHGTNRKVSNLINMMARAKGEVLVLSDSDIRAPATYLAAVTGALAEPDVGVVTCPYLGQGDGGVWSRFAAMGLSYQFLPNVITGVSLGLAKPCMGSTIALRRETLERIGGFGAFRDGLADDYALGAAVRALGMKSVVAPILVSHSGDETRLGAVFSHELRWARTVRGVDPAGHAGSLVTHPLPLAVMAAALLGASPAGLGLVVLAVLTRLCLKAAVDRVGGTSSGPWLWLPGRDILSFAVFVASFFGRAVVWGGEKFHVTSDGDLSPV